MVSWPLSLAPLFCSLELYLVFTLVTPTQGSLPTSPDTHADQTGSCFTCGCTAAPRLQPGSAH